MLYYKCDFTSTAGFMLDSLRPGKKILSFNFVCSTFENISMIDI